MLGLNSLLIIFHKMIQNEKTNFGHKIWGLTQNPYTKNPYTKNGISIGLDCRQSFVRVAPHFDSGQVAPIRQFSLVLLVVLGCGVVAVVDLSDSYIAKSDKKILFYYFEKFDSCNASSILDEL
jgi:hypothetical protein